MTLMSVSVKESFSANVFKDSGLHVIAAYLVAILLTTALPDRAWALRKMLQNVPPAWHVDNAMVSCADALLCQIIPTFLVDHLWKRQWCGAKVTQQYWYHWIKQLFVHTLSRHSSQCETATCYLHPLPRWKEKIHQLHIITALAFVLW